MTDTLSPIGAALHGLLTAGPSPWVLSSGWLELPARTLAVKAAGMGLLLHVGGDPCSDVLTTADVLALEPLVVAETARLAALARAGTVNKVARALGLEAT